MRLITLAFLATITGCAGINHNQSRIIFTPESMAKEDYNKDYIECMQIAKSTQTNTAQNAVAGAAAGAGLAALTGAILGVNSGYGRMAGVGALYGGLSGAGGSAMHNRNEYRRIFVQCMRDRNYQAY